MNKYAYLDMYDYTFIYNPYDPTVITEIQIRLDGEDIVEVSSISTEISGYDERIYVEGKRFIRKGERLVAEQDYLVYILEVEEDYHERIQQNRTNREPKGARRTKLRFKPKDIRARAKADSISKASKKRNLFKIG